MSDKLLARKGIITADFLTDKFRISGDVTLKSQPFPDMMNDKGSAFCRIENVYVSPIDDPTTFRAQYPVGQVRKQSVIAVVLTREEDGIARHSMYQVKLDAPVYFNLYVTAGEYEIRGGVKIASPVDVDNMLMQSLDPFMAVFRATASLVSDPEIQFSGGALLLNRNYANIYCVERVTG